MWATDAVRVLLRSAALTRHRDRAELVTVAVVYRDAATGTEETAKVITFYVDPITKRCISPITVRKGMTPA